MSTIVGLLLRACVASLVLGIAGLACSDRTNHASLRLTDDGGAIVNGIAQHTTQPGGGLFAMKAFAKDGALAGVAGVTVTPMAVVDPLVCAVATVPWATAVTTTPAVSTGVATLDEDAAVRPE